MEMLAMRTMAMMMMRAHGDAVNVDFGEYDDDAAEGWRRW